MCISERKRHPDFTILMWLDMTAVNKLRLFDLSPWMSLVKDGITFDKEDVEKNLTLFLSGWFGQAGNYCVFTSSILWWAIRPSSFWRDEEKHYDLVQAVSSGNPDQWHASFAIIPELIRILVEESLHHRWSDWSGEQNLCYTNTNHTILAGSPGKMALCLSGEGCWFLLSTKLDRDQGKI